jgi:hypothetical protein
MVARLKVSTKGDPSEYLWRSCLHVKRKNKNKPPNYAFMPLWRWVSWGINVVIV